MRGGFGPKRPRWEDGQRHSDSHRHPTLGGGGGAPSSSGAPPSHHTPSGSSAAAKGGPRTAAPVVTAATAATTPRHGAAAQLPPGANATVVTADGTELPGRINNKVFVDGLPYEEPTSGPSLLDQLSHMAEQWHVGKAVHLTKRPGHSFGYLAFRSPNSVDVAVRVLNGKKFLGRPLRVQLPKPPKEIDPATSYRVRGAPLLPEENVSRQVLLSDLPASIAQPEAIREVIKQYSIDAEQRIEMIKMAGKNRKAFVTLISALDVEPLVELMNGKAVLGRRIAATRALAPGTLPFSKTAPPPPAAGAAAAAAPRRFAPNDVVTNGGVGAVGVAPVSAAAAALLGSNAKKAFPMPDLLSNKSTAVAVGGGAPPSAPTAAPASKRPPAAAVPAALTVHGSNLVYVGGLSEDTTEEDLRRHFGAVGRVTHCELLVNPVTHESCGIAKVNFALPAFALRAKAELNGSILHGSSIRVDREGDPESNAVEPVDDDKDDEADADAMDDATYARERYGVADIDKFLEGSDDDDDDPPFGKKTSKKLAPVVRETHKAEQIGQRAGKKKLDGAKRAGADAPRANSKSVGNVAGKPTASSESTRHADGVGKNAISAKKAPSHPTALASGGGATAKKKKIISTNDSKKTKRLHANTVEF